MGEPSSRRVVVTGGGTGIGFETARSVVAAGGEVCVVGRREDVLVDAVDALGPRSWYHSCDVAGRDGATGLAAAVVRKWGALEGLVNNAGISPMASLDETEPELWDQTFAVNVRGPYLLCRALGPLLKKGSAPSVVNVSSTLAVKPIPGMAAYNASKAALNLLTQSLALEWAPTVRVNAVMPAVVDTPIHGSRGMDAAAVEAMGQIHPLGRIGQPGDVAAMIAFLLSEAAAWMTGAVIPVDGGMTAT